MGREVDLVYQSSRPRNQFYVIPIKYKLIFDLFGADNRNSIKHVHFSYLMQPTNTKLNAVLTRKLRKLRFNIHVSNKDTINSSTCSVRLNPTKPNNAPPICIIWNYTMHGHSIVAILSVVTLVKREWNIQNQMVNYTKRAKLLCKTKATTLKNWVSQSIRKSGKKKEQMEYGCKTNKSTVVQWATSSQVSTPLLLEQVFTQMMWTNVRGRTEWKLGRKNGVSQSILAKLYRKVERQQYSPPVLSGIDNS